MSVVLFGFALVAVVVFVAHFPVLKRVPLAKKQQVRESRVCYPLICLCLLGLYAFGQADHQPAYFSGYIGVLFLLLTGLIPIRTLMEALGWVPV